MDVLYHIGVIHPKKKDVVSPEGTNLCLTVDEEMA